MDFDESLRYMSGLLRFGWKLGNERMEALCERLGNPQERYAVIHIAGTKGKGSTTSLSAAILTASGFKTGAYFSPYVYDVRERIQVDGEMISREDFARLTTLVRPHIEALAETELGQTTEFELKTILAFLYFAEQKVDFACIEVGIGGRLDATNVVKPAVTVITNIGLDHTDILGETHGEIAGEKAGIIKPGIPCITATTHPEALVVISGIAEKNNAPLIRVTRGSALTAIIQSGEVQWDAKVENEIPEALASYGEDFAPLWVATPYHIYTNLEMRMGGLYQRENAACAITAVELALEQQEVALLHPTPHTGRMADTRHPSPIELALKQKGLILAESAVRKGLAETALPGRLTTVRLPDGPLVVLDGAHNALAAEALRGSVEELRKRNNLSKLFLVIGMVGGHSPVGILDALAPNADRIYVCAPDWKRAQPVEQLGSVASVYSAEVLVIPSVPEAVKSALRAADSETMVLITGSFYTVGEVPAAELLSWRNERIHL